MIVALREASATFGTLKRVLLKSQRDEGAYLGRHQRALMHPDERMPARSSTPTVQVAWLRQANWPYSATLAYRTIEEAAQRDAG